VVADPGVSILRAILSPFNAFVDEFNSTILLTIPGDAHVYNSKDIGDDDIGGSNEAVFADPEFLNSLKEPGVPPDELVLKIGAICRLTRNFDASQGLTKKHPGYCVQSPSAYRRSRDNILFCCWKSY
jgi:hypothetical protein